MWVFLSLLTRLNLSLTLVRLLIQIMKNLSKSVSYFGVSVSVGMTGRRLQGSHQCHLNEHRCQVRNVVVCEISHAGEECSCCPRVWMWRTTLTSSSKTDINTLVRHSSSTDHTGAVPVHSLPENHQLRIHRVVGSNTTRTTSVNTSGDRCYYEHLRYRRSYPRSVMRVSCLFLHSSWFVASRFWLSQRAMALKNGENCRFRVPRWDSLHNCEHLIEKNASCRCASHSVPVVAV